MHSSKESIGLLGGTFDPVHNGHLAIARSFLDSQYINRLWILLTPYPPHKMESSVSAYELRLEMLEMAFSGWDDVTVSDVENELPQPSYTVRTLRHLTEAHPDKLFYLCIGEDSARDFTQWYRWREILGYCELLIARRPGADLSENGFDEEIAQNAHLVEHEPVDISSSEIRQKISKGDSVSSLVPESVEDVIRKHELYLSS